MEKVELHLTLVGNISCCADFYRRAMRVGHYVSRPGCFFAPFASVDQERTAVSSVTFENLANTIPVIKFAIRVT